MRSFSDRQNWVGWARMSFIQNIVHPLNMVPTTLGRLRANEISPNLTLSSPGSNRPLVISNWAIGGSEQANTRLPEESRAQYEQPTRRSVPGFGEGVVKAARYHLHLRSAA